MKPDTAKKWAMTLVAVSASFLVGGYEFARSAAASLFIGEYGSSRMPYAMTATPFVMALFIYLYGLALSKLGGLRTYLACAAVSLVFFLACYSGVQARHGWAVAAFYIFAESYIVILVEQYWSFVNSTLTSTEAKIYNGPIAGGGAIGPVIAGWMMQKFAGAFGTEQFILLSAATLVPAAILMRAAYRLAGEPKPSAAEAGGRQGHVHISLVFKNRTLFFLAAAVFLAQILSTTVNLKFYDILEAALPAKDARTAFLGGFWMKANAAAFLLQFAATPFILRNFSTRAIMMAIPCLHLANAAALLFIPLLPVAALALGTFKSVDYSLFRAGKELLYIPLSYDARYRAKQIADSFTYRFSKGATAASLSLWKAAAGAVPPAAYACIAAISAACWAAVSFPLTAERNDSGAA